MVVTDFSPFMACSSIVYSWEVRLRDAPKFSQLWPIWDPTSAFPFPRSSQQTRAPTLAISGHQPSWMAIWRGLRGPRLWCLCLEHAVHLAREIFGLNVNIYHLQPAIALFQRWTQENLWQGHYLITEEHKGRKSGSLSVHANDSFKPGAPGGFCHGAVATLFPPRAAASGAR